MTQIFADFQHDADRDFDNFTKSATLKMERFIFDTLLRVFLNIGSLGRKRVKFCLTQLKKVAGKAELCSA
jgi:hypothetical protein